MAKRHTPERPSGKKAFKRFQRNQQEDEKSRRELERVKRTDKRFYRRPPITRGERLYIVRAQEEARTEKFYATDQKPCS